MLRKEFLVRYGKRGNMPLSCDNREHAHEVANVLSGKVIIREWENGRITHEYEEEDEIHYLPISAIQKISEAM